MKFQGALITEQDVTFAIAVVQPHVVGSRKKYDQLEAGLQFQSAISSREARKGATNSASFSLDLCLKIRMVEVESVGEIVPHLETADGIGRDQIDKLRKMGIETTSMLLERGTLPRERKKIAKILGVSPSLVLEWVVYSDFFRIKGMKREYVRLLQDAGVATVQELAMCDSEDLLKKLAGVNAEKRLLRRLPSRDQLKRWISQAKGLPSVIWFEGMYCCGLGDHV